MPNLSADLPNKLARINIKSLADGKNLSEFFSGEQAKQYFLSKKSV